MTNTPDLKTLRKALGLSVNQLADWLDVNERTVRRWEYGEIGTPKSILMCCAYRLENENNG